MVIKSIIDVYKYKHIALVLFLALNLHITAV